MLEACSPGGSKRAEAGKQARTAPKGRRKGAQKERRSYRVAKEVAKKTKNSLKNLTFGSLVFNVEFKRVVSRIVKAKVPEIIPEFSEKRTLFEAVSQMQKNAFRPRRRKRIEGRTLQINKQKQREGDLRTNTPTMTIFLRKKIKVQTPNV